MIDPEIHAFLREWDQAWSTLPAGADPIARRAHFETVARAMRQPHPDDVITDEWWVLGAGAERAVRVRRFRHRDPGAQACLVYLHGGAWMQGSPETHWDITAAIARANRQTVLSVDYALTPEHPFPAALHEVTRVVSWAFREAATLSIDPRAVAIGGDSAGANLAAAQTLVQRELGTPLIAQWLVYPAVDFDTDRPSHRENPNGPIVTVASMPFVNSLYCPDPANLRHPLAAPLRAASHQGLPPAYLAVAEHDPLRDEGLAYARALAQAGVSVTLDRGTGLIHGYLRAMAHCSAARRAFAAQCRWLAARNASALSA